MAIDKLFSVAQVAELLGGVSPWTVRAWLSKGVLRRTKVGGRTMVSESEITRFLAESNPSTRLAPVAEKGRGSGKG